MKQYAIGMSTCGELICPEDFLKYAKAGVCKMELSFPCNAYGGIDWAALKRGADSAGVELFSVHLPFSMESNPAQLDESVRQAAVKNFKNIMAKSSVTGAGVYVIHASSEPILDADRPAAMKNAKKSLTDLADFAQQMGVRIAVEDLPRTCLGKNSDEIFELISAHENLYVCFDTNHLLGEDISAFIERVGGKIITTHVSDYDFIDERHWLPGRGSINWPELMDALDNAGYNGPLMYELKMGRLTPEDFVQNAQELMERRPLTKR